MGKQVVLFYLADPKYGGWVSYTAHLALSLRERGWEPTLVKVGKRTENKSRPFGRGLQYQNLSVETAIALAKQRPSIVTAVGPKHAGNALVLFGEGARCIIHDPTELKDKGLVGALKVCARVAVVRETNLPALKALGIEAIYTPHPYVRMKGARVKKEMRAVAYSRLDWDKHTLTIAQANQLVPEEKRVHIYGAENRLYTHHKLDTAVPTWRDQYRGSFDTALEAGVRLAERAYLAVDLSAIAGDGDGTQYTFLEAWDAGTPLVVNRKWLKTGKGEVREGETAYAVGDAAELAALLKAPKYEYFPRAEAALERHAPEQVVPFYAKLLA